jgi:hypothetical protein
MSGPPTDRDGRDVADRWKQEVITVAERSARGYRVGLVCKRLLPSRAVPDATRSAATASTSGTNDPAA